MMARRCLLAMVVAALVLGGCSFQRTMDSMLPPEQQRRHIGVAAQLCTAPEALRPRIAPETWQRSAPLLPALARECAGWREAGARVTGYHWNQSSNSNSGSLRQESVTIVAGAAPGPWWETELLYVSQNGGPMQITAWNVRRSAEVPASIAFLAQYDAVRHWLMIGGAAFLAIVAGLVFWLVRRRKARGGSVFDP